MGEENNKSQNQEQPRRFNQEQYDLLKKCSDKGDRTEWNQYRKNNFDTDIELEGKFFNGWNLVGFNLNGGRFEEKENLLRQGEVYLGSSEFYRANMQGAQLRNTHLEKSFFYYTELQEAVFQGAYVDNFTEFWRCHIDRKTNFRGVPIDTAIIDPMTKSLLKYNIRRIGWEEWYKEHKILKGPVRLFWQMSDYGISTLRIITWFFGLAFGFAVIYRIWSGLVMVRGGGDHLRDFVHALYFSVVTMTTLGFGDIAANPDSHCGQMLLMIQVILGYVLLGALITRLAVLFTGEGPAGNFSDKKKN